jgi:hypothetical protein
MSGLQINLYLHVIINSLNVAKMKTRVTECQALLMVITSLLSISSCNVINGPEQQGNDNQFVQKDTSVNEVNPVPPQAASFSEQELEMINRLKELLPIQITDTFETKYLEWEATWSNPKIAIHSNPRKWAESAEYYDLLGYCYKYGKASWPLFLDKADDNVNMPLINLFEDMTFAEYEAVYDSIQTSRLPSQINNPYEPMRSPLIDYAVVVLQREFLQIVDAIKQIQME